MHLALFLTASLIVIIAPGPDNILVLTRGITLGRRAALISAGGAASGLVIHSMLAAAGLSALLGRSVAAYSVVKYVGAAYLLYLGVRALLSREHFSLAGEAAPLPLGQVYIQGVASNLLNPKIAVFFLAYLPQFADPAAGRLGAQLLLLGLIFAALTWGLFSAIAVCSGAIGGWLRRRPRAATRLGWLTGGVLVALGIRLALPERR